MRLIRALVISAGIGMALATKVCAQPGVPKTQTIAVRPTLSLPQIPANDSLFSGCVFNGKTALNSVSTAWQGDVLHILLQGQDSAKVILLELVVQGGQFQSKLSLLQNENRVGVEATDQVLVVDKAVAKNTEGFVGFLNFRGSNATFEGGNWSEKNDWVDSKFVVSGPFKVVW